MKLILTAAPLMLSSILASASAQSWTTSPSVSSASNLIGAFADIDEVCTVDVDSDGDMDVAAANDDGQVYLWENADGTGTAWSGRSVGSGSDCIGVVYPVDLDDDGAIDLVSGDTWFANSDGLGDIWVSHTIPSYSSITSMSVTDINGDSRIDVLQAYMYCNQIRWYQNMDGTGTQWLSHQITVMPYQPGAQVCAGDLDRDGDIDIALYERDEVEYLYFFWLENLGSGFSGWDYHYLVEFDDTCWDLHIADVGQDIDGDIITACMDGGVRFYENIDGFGRAWAIQDVDGAVEDAREAEFADFDADGDLDIAAAYWSGADNVAWFENLDGSGGQWLKHGLGTGYPNPDGLRSSDIDGDGSLDIVISSSTAVYWIDLSLVGVGDGPAPAVFSLLPVTPNPSSGPAFVNFEMPEAGMIGLSVFDISGRMVQSAGPVPYQPGCHSFQLESMRPGIYFVRMQAGESEATARFVVIE